MAKVDREFLVPYLRDICALYMAERKLEKIIAKLTKKIEYLSGDIYVNPPKEPVYESTGCFEIFGWILGLFMTGGPILCLLSGEDLSGFEALVFVAILVGVGILIFVGSATHEQSKTNKIRQEVYEAALAEYKVDVDNAKQQTSMNHAKVPALQEERQTYIDELKKVNRLLKKVYSANVIPSHYRDVYAAVYLYDFFSTGRSDDLDMALNTFVLEQIKEKLDIIIQQQADIILHQRIMMVTQQKALEEQREHNAYLENKARRIAENMEERNQYLSMIESNTAATAYFAAATYLKN